MLRQEVHIENIANGLHCHPTIGINRGPAAKENDPLVYAQEYLAQFVDWAGVAFFSREKLLVNGQPLTLPPAL